MSEKTEHYDFYALGASDHMQQAASQDVLDRENLQFFDLKQMAEIQARYRNRVRILAAKYRAWRTEHEGIHDVLDKVYSSYDGIFLRRQLADAYQMYRIINKDFHELQDMYLTQIQQRKMNDAVKYWGVA